MSGVTGGPHDGTRVGEDAGAAWTRDRLPTLTALRFWAALLVVLYHLSLYIGEVPVISDLVRYGRSGVTFFFVLSGFVLAWTYHGRKVRLVAFWWKRFARIWPLVIVTGLLSLGADRIMGEDVPFQRVLATGLLLQAWRPELAAGANPAAWSLSDEAFFYLLFPLLLALASIRHGARAFLAASAVALVTIWLVSQGAGWSAWATDYFPPSRLLQFVVGVACGVLMRRGVRAPLGWWTSIALVVGFHALLLPWESLIGRAEPFGAYVGSQWWAVLVFTPLIMAAAQRDISRARGDRREAGPWSGWIALGHWSYAWYLIHAVIISLWVHWLPPWTSLKVVVVAWALLLAITLAASALLYRLVEHPAELRLRRLVS